MSKRVLVIDDNLTVLEIVTLFVESCDDCEVVGATSGNDAITILEEEDPIQLIICDYNMPNGNGADVYHYLKDNELNIPFILQTAEPIEIIDDFVGFPHNDSECYIQKPFTFEQVTEAVNRLLSIEETDEDDRFVRVSIPTYKKYSQVKIDAYLQLSLTKYVRFHYAEDDLDEVMVNRYEKKGLTHFYIKSKDYRKFLDSCHARLREVLLSSHVSPEELHAAQFDTVENIKMAVKNLGVSEHLIEQADELTASILSNIPKKSGIDELIRNMRKENEYLSKLSVMVGYTAVAIADEISWADKVIYEKLVTAAIFMDLAWMEMDESDYDPIWGEISYRDDLRMKSLDRKTQGWIKQHPVDSAALFEQVGFNSDIYNLICDHHERPEGRGFPKGGGGLQISSLASIFTLAHEFCSRILLCEDFNIEKYAALKKGIVIEFQEGHYKEPCKAFLKVFCS